MNLPARLILIVLIGACASHIALADEAPVWTERQFSIHDLSFSEDPTGFTYPVSLMAMDAEGNPIAEQQMVTLSAERPTLDKPIYNGSFFAEDTAYVALLPDGEGTWQIAVRSVAEQPVAGWRVIFEEPFEGPVPMETAVDASLSQVWRQYRQVARGVPLADVSRQVDTALIDIEAGNETYTSGMETEGAMSDTGRRVDEIDVFISDLAELNRPSHSKRIRQSRARRMRR